LQIALWRWGKVVRVLPKSLMRVQTDEWPSPAQSFESLGGFVLILDYQCGKQIININKFSPLRRFETRKENYSPSAFRVQLKHIQNCVTDLRSGRW
jgi:hypothetical protein